MHGYRANNFDASGKDWELVCAELGTCLGSSRSSLRQLVLNANVKVGSNIRPLLSVLRVNHSRFSSLGLAATALNPDASIALAEWLEDPEGVRLPSI